MSYATVSILLSLALFAGMIVAQEYGRRLGRRRLQNHPDATRAESGPVNAALIGLLGLLLAFTFSGAASRFDTRREQINEESNDIGTAWLRIDLLPEATQAPLRDLFRRYLDSRLETYRQLPDLDAAFGELERAAAIQVEIWNKAVAACAAKSDSATTSLVLGALNTMFDISATRTATALRHPPPVVFELLFILALGCAVLAGYGMANLPRADWLHEAAFAGSVALCVWVILNLEFPRAGFIRLDGFDEVLVQLRRTMGS